MAEESEAPSYYYNEVHIRAAVRAGEHRAVIGGMWEEIGLLQTNFLLGQGLSPQHKLIDIGCGSLRAGVKLVRYLDRGNYFGTDINESLLQAGLDIELAEQGLAHKVPRANLVADGDFDFSWSPVAFDFALAQSLFTHLRKSHLRQCLSGLHSVMVSGASLYATFFIAPERHPAAELFPHPSGIVTHPNRDPFHLRYAEIRECCDQLPWQPRLLGDWGHPRSQQMVQFRYVP
jgi:SAM-dependent methyltransferase